MTLILCATDFNFVSQFRYVAIGQASNGTNTLDQFWGGSFYSPTQHTTVAPDPARA